MEEEKPSRSAALRVLVDAAPSGLEQPLLLRVLPERTRVTGLRLYLQQVRGTAACSSLAATFSSRLQRRSSRRCW